MVSTALDAAAKGYRQKGEALAKEIGASLKKPADLSAIDPAWEAFLTAYHALDDFGASSEEVELIRREYMDTVEWYQLVRTSLHEAAHSVVAHLVGLGIVRSTVVPDEHGRGRTVIVDYDPAEDGSLPYWARRYAVFAVAGFSGETLLAPRGPSPGADEDFKRALLYLARAGLDAKAEMPDLQKLAVELVLGAKPAVFGVARTLLADRQIERAMVLNILAGQLEMCALDQLEERRRELDR
jgi:hypothetical protein